jgi:hypothetical protein
MGYTAGCEAVSYPPLYEVALKHQKSKSIIRVHFVMLAFDNN